MFSFWLQIGSEKSKEIQTSYEVATYTLFLNILQNIFGNF